MQIRQVERPRDIRRFVRFPHQLYHDCPQWVPEMLSDARGLLDPHKHPFYEHSEACFYLAEERGRVVGRIAVMENRRYNVFCGRAAIGSRALRARTRCAAGCLVCARYIAGRSRAAIPFTPRPRPRWRPSPVRSLASPVPN